MLTSLRGLVHLGFAHGCQLGTGDQPGIVEAGLFGQRGHGMRIVAGDDLQVDAQIGKGTQGLLGLGTQFVAQADQGQGRQGRQRGVAIGIMECACLSVVGKEQHAQPGIGQSRGRC